MQRRSLVGGCLALMLLAGAAASQPPLADRPGLPGPVSVIGKSTQGRNIGVLVLSTAGDADAKPALAIVAGIDGRHTIGVEVAQAVAQRLIADHADLLRDHTVYVIANANPDAIARWREAGARPDWGGTLSPRDDDRDRRTDEDPPADINGDGHITMMRVHLPAPSTGLSLTHVVDGDEPQIVRSPDGAKNERATHALLVEGLDADGDGRIAEDGVGGVNLDRNFPYLWPETAPDAGMYPLSEPESRAIADWMIARTNIVAVIVYGPDDTIVKIPASGRMDVSGRVPLGIEEDDKAVYESLSKAFKDITHQTAAPSGDNAGSLQGWAYAHLGVLSFETPIWVRPDQVRKEGEAPSADRAAPADKPAAPTPDDERAALIAQGATPRVAEFLVATPERRREMMQEVMSMSAEERAAMQADFQKMPAEIQARLMQAVQQMRPDDTPNGTDALNSGALNLAQPAGGRTGGRRGGGQPGGGPPAGGGGGGPAASASTGEDGKWLTHARDRGEGFVEWQPFDHPTLGPVEIGGFVPGFKINPPASELDRLVQEQTEVVTMLLGKMPRVVIEPATVESLGGNLWRISLRVVNEGELPSRMAVGVKARRRAPMQISMDLEPDRIVSGPPRRPIQRLTQNDSTALQWIVSGQAGSTVTVRLASLEFGETTQDIRLEAAANPSPAGEGGGR